MIIIQESILARLIADTNIPIDKEVLRFKVFSLEQHLTRAMCPPDRYEEVYNESFQIYLKDGFGKGPWNVFYMLEAWNRIRNYESNIAVNPYFVSDDEDMERALLFHESCTYCKGMGITIENGKVVYFTDEEGNRKVKPCGEC